MTDSEGAVEQADKSYAGRKNMEPRKKINSAVEIPIIPAA
jgi:hypothetical protein